MLENLNSRQAAEALLCVCMDVSCVCAHLGCSELINKFSQLTEQITIPGPKLLVWFCREQNVLLRFTRVNAAEYSKERTPLTSF